MKYKLDSHYHSLDRLDKWDETTQGVIKKRLEKEIDRQESFVFLTSQEGAKLEKLIDVLLPQPSERSEGSRRDLSLRQRTEFRIKIAEMIDRGLSDQKIGVRYAQNPWRGDFYRKGLAEFGRLISEREIKKILEKSSDSLAGRFIDQVLTDSISIYYSHPFAWDKIGFPGPAYPEGYAYLSCGEKDEWEPKYFKD